MNDMTAISTDLATTTALTPAVVFAPGGVETLLGKIEAEVRAVETDISTAKGRKEVASLAYKVARSKTALDAAGKTLTDEWRQQTNQVNAERRTIATRLEALQAEVRRPLTEWEDAERARVAAHELALTSIPETFNYGETETPDELRLRLAHLQAYPQRDWQEFRQRADRTLAAEIARIEGLLAAAVQREVEAAELARHQAEAAERDRQEAARVQAEREARIATEAAEQARLAAEERAAAAAREVEARAQAERQAAARAADAERQRVAAEQARVERQRQEAEARAAQLEAQARQAERDRQVAAEQAERARVAAAARAEQDRAAAIATEQRRAAEAAAAAQAETDRRAADKRHRATFNREAAAGLTALGWTEEQAIAVITAIIQGAVPHVAIHY